MVVVYYASTNFLDVILETIQSLKNKVELHVVIEINPSSKNTTIINVDDLDRLNEIETGENVLGKTEWAKFKPYFEGVASVQFTVHKNVGALSFKSLRIAYSLGKYLKKYNADIVHFDTISTRAIGMVPYLLTKKVFITLHDPAPHSGEEVWRDKVPNYVFFPLAKGYFFYSKFALQQFRGYFKSIKKPGYVVKLQPYSFISQYLSKNKPAGSSILFFGRLSYYKGIDLLIAAIPIVLSKYPDEKFIIAGKPSYGYDIDEAMIEKYKNNIELVRGFLSTPDLVSLIENAKFIVCPYRDATQSGVLMTAYAAGKMVLATDVGSFPEYIRENENGLLALPDPQSIAHKIIEALDKQKYKRLESRVIPGYSQDVGNENGNCFLEAYKKAF